MENEVLASIELGDMRSLHIATLADETIKECDADHLGLDGYFIFTVSERPECQGFDILAKAFSFGTALSLAEIMSQSPSRIGQ